MRTFTTFHFLLILAAVAMIFSGCGKKHQYDDKMVFRYNESSGVSSLDPAYSRNLENIWACNMLYNGLVEINDSLEVVPSIAKNWEVDSTGLTYTFHLREDVFFHDHKVFPNGKGRRVVASDVAYSFNRILDPKNTSPGGWVFNALRKENPFEVIDENTISIHLAKPFPPFLGLLGMEYCSVIPKEAIDKYGDDFRKNPIGTGPFQFNFWIENTRLVMIKNPNYFEKDESGQALPYLDAVSISFIPDKSAAFLELLKGNFDFMSGLHSSYSDELLMPDGTLNPIYDKQLYLQKYPFLKTDYFGFTLKENDETDPWQDVRLRRAVNYAINRDDMVRYLRNNVYTPAHGGFIPAGMPGYSASNGYAYQPDSVRALLIRAGYPNGEGLPTLTLTTTSDYVDLCEYAQHQVSQFGIEMKVDVLPASVHREMSARGDLPFFRKSWLADYPDDENFMALFYSDNWSPNGPNYTRYKSTKADSLYNAALATTVPALRKTLYCEMDSIVMADAPIVALYYDMVMRFVSNDVSGLDRNPMNVLDLRKVKMALKADMD
jgi:peptide/nickel transport system substrate-binding protein